ncbi:MAG TPA: DUF2478 domain-containing protein [Pusillimonas sp.]|uniref:DUF2478 domain-containing protein n=1 Tax=Pusillimonas sp. TaxID=3040095 RepID=UPI002C3FDD9C|nr:DUF2478 domain-containing protein [Pusillimonas sp.]HUH87796.1 DUF2478 domain-containing protein [Pusillimonas sp.]
MHATEETIAVAAIVHPGKGVADGPLLEFVNQAQTRGYTLRGLVPGLPGKVNGSTTRTVLDLEHGTVYPISQALGKQSAACSLDAGALLEAGVVLRRAAQAKADLIVVNRFGVLEAEGDGFSAEMLELMSKGFPLLTVVSEPHLEAWRTFTGGLAAELPPEPEAINDWFERVLASRSGALCADGMPHP